MKNSRATSLRCLKKKQKQNKNVQLKFFCEQIFKKQWQNKDIYRKEMTNSSLVSHLGDYEWASLPMESEKLIWGVQVF